MRGWAVTAWPVEPLILETSPRERVELPHANRASPGTRCAHVQVCREVLEERAWGRAGVGSVLGTEPGVVALLGAGDR